MMKLIIPVGLEPRSPSFEVTTGLFGQLLKSYKTETFTLTEHLVVISITFI